MSAPVAPTNRVAIFNPKGPVRVGDDYYKGKAILVTANGVWVDGKQASALVDFNPTIEVNGNCEGVKCDSGEVNVKGNVDSVQTWNGEVNIDGDVKNVTSMRGDVTVRGCASGSAESVERYTTKPCVLNDDEMFLLSPEEE